MARQSFSWDRFIDLIGINFDKVTPGALEQACRRADFGVATKMFYTAYSVAKNVLQDRYAVSWNEIDALNLPTSVSSQYFSVNSGSLRTQMNNVGARLLQYGGENQYIRTIAFYSGAALVRVIKSIAEELQSQKRTLTDYALLYHTPEEVKNDLSAYVERHAGLCLNGFSEDERRGVRDDISPSVGIVSGAPIRFFSGRFA